MFRPSTRSEPSSDQERALEFYVGKLGFEQRADFLYGDGHRWIEVAPPGAANSISLVSPTEGASTGGDQAFCAFATEDIEADHAALRAGRRHRGRGDRPHGEAQAWADLARGQRR